MTLKKKGDHGGFLHYQDSAGKCCFPENSAAKWWPPLHLLSRLQTRPRLCWGSPPNLPSLCNAQLEQPFTSGFYLINIIGPTPHLLFASYEHLLHQEWVQQSFSDGRFYLEHLCNSLHKKRRTMIAFLQLLQRGVGGVGGQNQKLKCPLQVPLEEEEKSP